jgi:integrase/recombinase XerD
MREQNAKPATLLFTNYCGEKLTRNGINYILKKAVARATHDCPALATKHISHHVIRYAIASHLLQPDRNQRHRIVVGP